VITVTLKNNQKVDDAGLGHLRITSLEKLDLSGTRVTDSGLLHFNERVHPNLKRLDLRGTRVTEAEVKALRKRLPERQIKWDGKEKK
jgi:hypothetical protein